MLNNGLIYFDYRVSNGTYNPKNILKSLKKLRD